MMRKVFAAALAPALAYGWLVAASALYLAVTGKMTLFVFPFTQWLQAARYWRLNTWMTLYVLASATAPSLLILLCGFGLARHQWRQRRALYGKTDWANQRQMQSAGISASRKPF